jgi:hypothetical protein
MLDANRWEHWYMRTIVEKSGQQIPEQINSTRRAIARRLLDLEHDSDHHAERCEIESALRALNMLEVEAQRWKS